MAGIANATMIGNACWNSPISPKTTGEKTTIRTTMAHTEKMLATRVPKSSTLTAEKSLAAMRKPNLGAADRTKMYWKKGISTANRAAKE